MGKGILWRHRTIGVAALLSLGGIAIAACTPVSEEAAAPVYLMGTVAPDGFGKITPVMRQTVAAAPNEAPVSEPTPLAPSLTASAAAGQPTSDVIPLDDPPAPAKQATKPALLAANPAPMSARFMPPPDLTASPAEPAPAPMAVPKSGSPTAAPAPAPITAPQPAAAAVASSRPEPSAAELARAEPPPAPAAVPVSQSAPPIAQPAMAQPAMVRPAMVQPAIAAASAMPPVPIAEPQRADIATAGLIISARDERTARARPRYYFAP